MTDEAPMLVGRRTSASVVRICPVHGDVTADTLNGKCMVVEPFELPYKPCGETVDVDSSGHKNEPEENR